MQADHDLYGIESFEFIILEETTSDKLRQVEQKYIDKLSPDEKYNIADNAKGGVGPITDAARKKMSKSRLGKKRTAEQRAKMGQNRRGANHKRFCGYYVTPTGRYASGKSACVDIDLCAETVISWCKHNPDKVISKISYDLSPYLKSLGPTVIGKTFRDLGFYFVAKGED